MCNECGDIINSKMYEVKITNFVHIGEYVIYEASIRNLTTCSTHTIHFRYKTLKKFHKQII